MLQCKSELAIQRRGSYKLAAFKRSPRTFAVQADLSLQLIIGANVIGMAGNQSAEDLVNELSERSLYKFPALLLVGIGSREQERLTNLGTAVALAVRYSFDILSSGQIGARRAWDCPNPYVDDRLSRAV